MHKNTQLLLPVLQQVINEELLGNISPHRILLLHPLVEYIQQKVEMQQQVRLNFICTHNSRRSHLSQVWAQTMAANYDVPGVYCYSGGTRATALFPAAASTLEQQGFEITKLSQDMNPVYSIKFAESAHPVIGFSKVYDHPFNPSSGFAAIMTCSQADAGCPFIAGAEKRIALTYEDPKAFDGTAQQGEMYMRRSLQIASELKHVFSKINNPHGS